MNSAKLPLTMRGVPRTPDADPTASRTQTVTNIGEGQLFQDYASANAALKPNIRRNLYRNLSNQNAGGGSLVAARGHLAFYRIGLTESVTMWQFRGQPFHSRVGVFCESRIGGQLPIEVRTHVCVGRQ